MTKYLACFALLGALIAFAPAPASAANDRVQTSAPEVQHDEISSQYYYGYRRYRPYRYYKPYRYYYRPRYYRPYRYYRYY